MQLKVNILQQNKFNNKNGFALIELLVSLLIIGIMVTIGIPRFFGAGNLSLERFVTNLNLLTQESIAKSINDGISYKINFNFNANLVELKDVKSNKILDKIDMPKNLILQELFINGKSEPGKEEAWLFVSPDGTTQEFIMNITDIKLQEKTRNMRGNYGLVLNPIAGIFKIYDKFQRP